MSIADTVDAALRIHPETKEIFVIGRNSVAADKANRDSFLAALSALPPQLKITFWDDLPMAHLKARLEILEQGAVVFINGLIANEEGLQMMYADTTRWICDISPVPCYSLWDVYLGYGIVGGKLVSGYRQGRIAAEMAIRVLKGENADHIPVASAAEANQFMFDFRELERLNAPLSLLPKDAVFIHKPYPFYEQHRTLVLTTTAVLLVLTGLLAMLGIAVIRRRRTEEALRKSKKLYTSLVNTIPDAIIRADMNGALLPSQTTTPWRRAATAVRRSKEGILSISCIRKTGSG